MGNVNKPVISEQYDDGWAFVQENTTEIKSSELQMANDYEEKKDEMKFLEADKIRNKLALNGIILEDSPSGTKWRINN